MADQQAPQITPAVQTPPPLPPEPVENPQPTAPEPPVEQPTVDEKPAQAEQPPAVEKPAEIAPAQDQPAPPAPEPVKEEPTLETKIRMSDQEKEEKGKKEKKIRKGGLGIGCSCRALGCGFVFLIVAIIVGIVILFATRPDWFKDFLNAGLVEPVYDGTTAASAYSRIALQFDSFGIGQNDLQITEDQAQAIISDQFGSGLKVDVRVNDLKLFLDIDGGETPLWLVMDVVIDEENNPKFTNIGFERFGLPPFLNNILSEILLSLAGVVSDEERGFIETMLNLPENVTIRDIRFLNDQMIITLEVTTGLNGLFTE